MDKYLFESDYSSDALRWSRLIDDRQIKPNPYSKDKTGYNPEELEKLQNHIIKEEDAALACFCAMDFSYKVYRMQKIILDKQDVRYAFLFAQNVKGCDITALQKVVVDSKKIKYICKFACFVRGADRKALEACIVKSKNVKYAHMYLKHVKSADVSKFKNIIINSKKPRYLFELARHLTDDKDIAVVQDLIIQSGSFTYMKLFAEKIKRADVEKIEQAVLDTENTVEIKKFAKYVKRSKMRRFFLVM